MLMVEDISSNSMQRHPNSLEVLKQTMLSQEDIFREQVHELHRLYDTQKNLMADFDRKQQLDGQRQPTFRWLTNPVNHSFQANETKFSMLPMAGSSQSTSRGFWDVNQSIPSRLQQKPWDLILPADQRFHVACPEKVDLTLSIGGRTMKKDVDKGYGNCKICKTNISSFHHVIDLEESMDEDVKSASTLSSIALVNNQGSQASVQSNHVSPLCVKDGSESYEEHNSSNQAFKEHHGVITPTIVLNQVKPSISKKAAGLDLNISQFDESLSLNDSVTCLSTAGSSGGLNGSVSKIFMQTSFSQSNWREPKVSIFSGSFDSAEVSERNNELGLDDDDVLVRKAAELLLHLSLRSPGTEDRLTIVEPNVIVDDEEDEPLRSVDSFEAMALKMTEEEDDYAVVTSKAYEPSEFDSKKVCGVKLTRGRRLKDFQKDVLPSLSTLASHEIREDLQIMETVIRSREYKRMRSKTISGGGNCFAPVKSKRSRLNYVRRFC